MPLDETLTVLRTMDRLRGQWGLVYPAEKKSLDLGSRALGVERVKSR